MITGASESLYGVKYNALTDFYTSSPSVLGLSFVNVNIPMIDYAIDTATIENPGTISEKMYLWIGDGDELIINSGHGYYRDHRSQ